MVSKHLSRKVEAMKLRKSGQSIKAIEKILGIPRSTLSGWFKEVQLSEEQKLILQNKCNKALVTARIGAVKWHHKQKELRIQKARNEAKCAFDTIEISDKAILELALAMLYWGEGAKTGNRLLLGNSDPSLLRFFLDGIVRVYNLPRNSVRCALHLRADQNIEKMKLFWSLALDVPMECFKEAYFDPRTKNSPTRQGYHGVCAIMYYTSHYSRRLLSMGLLLSQMDFENLDR